MIFRCEGQIRIQTLAAMMVPNNPPTWMYTARPDMKRESTQAKTATSTNEMAAPVVSFLIAFHIAS